MQSYRYPSRVRRHPGLGGLSQDDAYYSRAPNALTHRAAMYQARLYAAATRSSLEISSSSSSSTASSHITTSTTSVDGNGPQDTTMTMAAAGLGDLDYLPTEVLMIVLEHCTLRALLRLLRVNRTANTMVRCLRDFDSVADTIKGNKARARGPYPEIWAKLVRINTFHGMRQLMLCKTCDKCGDGKAKLRVAKVKILCEKCDSPMSRRL
ncbi:hypothetical protein PG991_001660 [Apiospora marii]|uniref:F-box domain-containing protein n=1 Tax=Apiospora marii TaxID=335849 RepID=A0ABR1SQA9_9PEZI